MELKNSIKNSLFIKSFRLAKSNPAKMGLMVLFDLLFVVSFVTLQRLFGYFAQNIALPSIPSSILVLSVYSVIYYLIVLFVYSFFKYCLLDFIKSLFGKTAFSFGRLGHFYLVNIIITAIFFAVMLLLNAMLIGIKQSYAPFVFIALAVPYLLFLYITFNIAHSAFSEGNSIKNTLQKSFQITFTKMREYREIILTIILFALVLWLLFLGSGYLIRIFTSKNYLLYLNVYSHFKQASIVALDAAIYLIALLNRISFYAAVKKNKG